MKKNIGTQESNYRMIAGAVIVLFALFFVDTPTVKIVLAVVASVLAGTAFIRFCPINLALKRNSSDTEGKQPQDSSDEEEVGEKEMEEGGDESEKLDE